MTVQPRVATLLQRKDEGARFTACTSRSLMLERLADPGLGTRKAEFFTNLAGIPAHPEKSRQWLRFLIDDLQLAESDLLYAQLQSRLMVNMGGGVIENAGLCLDRASGLPYIPGSAVRGCARREAIAEAEAEPDPTAKRGKLVEIALVFGWGETDWITRRDCRNDADWGKKRPDFAFVFGDDDWNSEFVAGLQSAIWDRLQPSAIGACSPEHWRNHLSHYQGQVSFLPAWPVEVAEPTRWQRPVPNLGTLETEILTAHYKSYYSGTGNADALDNEDPEPHPFPAVAAGHVFVFAARGEGRSESLSLARAREWLRQGLRTKGIGAKVGAGYGQWLMREEASASMACDLFPPPKLTGLAAALQAFAGHKLNGMSPESLVREFLNLVRDLPDADLKTAAGRIIGSDFIVKLARGSSLHNVLCSAPGGREILGRLGVV